MTKAENVFDSLCNRARREFSTASDFVWKTPRFLEHEAKLEAEKLEEYYHINQNTEKDDLVKELRQLRATLEFRKIYLSFPFLMSTGNVFTIFSLFETYCLLLSKHLESLCAIQLKAVPGSGVNRLFKHLLQCGLKLDRVPLRQEVLAAGKIRNCLFHASGLLSLSREEAELRNIVAQTTYLSKEHRQRYLELEKVPNEIRIQSGLLGDQLIVTNDYAWLLCNYLQDHFLGLCKEADNIFARRA